MCVRGEGGSHLFCCPEVGIIFVLVLAACDSIRFRRIMTDRQVN